MPGLIEPHSHPSFADTAVTVELGFIPPEEHMLLTARNARRMLDQGFTSCNSAASAKPRLDVALRDAIDRGDLPGPRTLAASMWPPNWLKPKRASASMPTEPMRIGRRPMRSDVAPANSDATLQNTAWSASSVATEPRSRW